MTHKEAKARFKQLKPAFSDEYKNLLKLYERSLKKNTPHIKAAFTASMEEYTSSKFYTRPDEL